MLFMYYIAFYFVYDAVFGKGRLVLKINFKSIAV